MEAEIIDILKKNLRDEKERNIEYVITLKDFIQHLKYEINEKNKDIRHKNYLLKKSNMTSNEFNKAEVETSLQSSLASVTQKSEVFGNNNASSSIHDNQTSQSDNEISIIVDDTNGTCYSNRESDNLFPTAINTDRITDNRHRREKFNEKNRNIKIPLKNSFNTLYVEEDNIGDKPIVEINKKIEKRVVNNSTKKKTIKNNSKNANRVFVSKHPERNTLPSRSENNLNKSTKRKKIVITNDSITKPIGMRIF